MLGRRAEDTSWFIRQVSDYDARVRANLVEDFWGNRPAEVQAVFERAVHDTNARVAGNACSVCI